MNIILENVYCAAQVAFKYHLVQYKNNLYQAQT